MDGWGQEKGVGRGEVERSCVVSRRGRWGIVREEKVYFVWDPSLVDVDQRSARGKGSVYRSKGMRGVSETLGF